MLPKLFILVGQRADFTLREISQREVTIPYRFHIPIMAVLYAVQHTSTCEKFQTFRFNINKHRHFTLSEKKYA